MTQQERLASIAQGMSVCLDWARIVFAKAKGCDETYDAMRAWIEDAMRACGHDVRVRYDIVHVLGEQPGVRFTALDMAPLKEITFVAKVSV